MQLHKHLLKSLFGKAALAAAALAGFLFLGGAPSAQAREVVVVRRAVARPVVVVHRGFYAPRPFYYGRPVVVVHGWYDRFGCWHRY
jgi:hypothetical protein